MAIVVGFNGRSLLDKIRFGLVIFATVFFDLCILIADEKVEATKQRWSTLFQLLSKGRSSKPISGRIDGIRRKVGIDRQHDALIGEISSNGWLHMTAMPDCERDTTYAW